MTSTNSGIAKLDPRLDALIPANASLDVVADFSERDGPHWLEGPVWNWREKCLLFSDVKASAIRSWDRDHGVRLFMQPSGYTGRGAVCRGLARLERPRRR